MKKEINIFQEAYNSLFHDSNKLNVENVWS